MDASRWLMVLAMLGAVACGPATKEPVVTTLADPSSAPEDDGPPKPLELRDGPFELVRESDGVSVFQRSDPSLISVGAEGKLPAAPEQVLTALLDYSRHPAVLERLDEARVLKRGEHWLVVYQRLGLPVIDDRDFILRYRWGKEGDRHWIRYRTTQGPAPVDGVIRVTRHFGGWDLIPVDGGEATLARYVSNIDMGGALPLWMTQGGAADELPAMFRAMCGLLPAPASSKCSG